MQGGQRSVMRQMHKNIKKKRKDIEEDPHLHNSEQEHH